MYMQLYNVSWRLNRLLSGEERRHWRWRLTQVSKVITVGTLIAFFTFLTRQIFKKTLKTRFLNLEKPDMRNLEQGCR